MRKENEIPNNYVCNTCGRHAQTTGYNTSLPDEWVDRVDVTGQPYVECGRCVEATYAAYDTREERDRETENAIDSGRFA